MQAGLHAAQSSAAVTGPVLAATAADRGRRLLEQTHEQRIRAARAANKMARLCYATLRDHEPYAAARLTRALPRKLTQVSFSCA